MPLRSRHKSLFVTLVVLASCAVTAMAGELRPRPQLIDYNSEAAFVRDVLAWEREKRQWEQRQANAPAPVTEEAADPNDWHHITGPENLDEALRNAYGYEQPNYREKYRFNRTTHLSFPLERLPPQQLSRSAITGVLQEAGDEERSLQPLPELRTIIEETNEMLELGELSPRQAPESSFSDTPRVSQHVDVTR